MFYIKFTASIYYEDETVAKGRPDSLATKVSVEEPEFEFDDETGLDLEAHDGRVHFII